MIIFPKITKFVQKSKIKNVGFMMLPFLPQATKDPGGQSTWTMWMTLTYRKLFIKTPHKFAKKHMQKWTNCPSWKRNQNLPES